MLLKFRKIQLVFKTVKKKLLFLTIIYKKKFFCLIIKVALSHFNFNNNKKENKESNKETIQLNYNKNNKLLKKKLEGVHWL